MFYENSVKVDRFYPKGKKFCMNLFKGTCHERLTGKCSILKSNQIQIPFEDITKHRNYISRNDEEYCQCIARSIESHFDESKFPICLELCTCGHFIVVDGQHRLCISSKINIPITVYTSTYNDVCPYCREAHDYSNLRRAFATLRGKGHYRLVRL